MKIKVMNWMLMAIVVFGLGMCVISCSDDDDNSGKSEEQKEQEAQEKASKFWDVVGQLVSDKHVSDYKNKTFEPTIGIVGPNDPQTRIVNTNDLKTAAMRFADLVGVSDIDENTQSYQWSDDEVGTLTYTRVGTSQTLATVDVDIKQIPHLTKIVYGVAGDDNMATQSAYYRFGDVISRLNEDNKREYWICVRPAFCHEGKETSHWVCVNTVPSSNYKYYKTSQEIEHWLPTDIGTNKEQMQNFAEMLYAICEPLQWYNNADWYHEDGWFSFDGVPIFHDFTHENLRYHNEYFWRNVQEGWKQNDIAKKALNLVNFDQLYQLITFGNGVHLLYNGYSWWFTSSWNCQLWEAVYTNNRDFEENRETMNMHQVIFNEKVKMNMKDKTSFDCREMGKNTSSSWYFGDEKVRWVIRHATGDELAKLGGGNYNWKEKIPGFTEEYRYYRDMCARPDLTEQPEITATLDYTQRGFYNYGDVVKDDKGNKWFCVQPSGYQWIDDPEKEHTDDYAYFISYDRGAVGSNLENIPTSKDLVMQMLFCLEIGVHNGISKGNIFDQGAQNIKKYADVTLTEIVGIRDTTVKHQGATKPAMELNSYVNTLYRENGQLYVFRCVGDYTRDQVSDGSREWSWDFWTRYTKTTPSERKMLLSDLADQNIINQYNEDLWVNCSWYDITTMQEKVTDNMGLRKQTEAITPLSRFIYQKGVSPWTTQAPANMYREPLYAFAVKRVKDMGKKSDTFEDGTKLEHVKLMKHVDPKFALKDASLDMRTIGQTYISYINYSIRVDGQFYSFSLKNKP